VGQRVIKAGLTDKSVMQFWFRRWHVVSVLGPSPKWMTDFTFQTHARCSKCQTPASWTVWASRTVWRAGFSALTQRREVAKDGLQNFAS